MHAEELGRVKGIEKIDNIDVKVLLKPYNITVCTVENLGDVRKHSFGAQKS